MPVQALTQTIYQASGVQFVLLDGYDDSCFTTSYRFKKKGPSSVVSAEISAAGVFSLADDHPYGTSHPILLPKDHHVTTLTVIDAHERLGHGSGMQHVQTELESRF